MVINIPLHFVLIFSLFREGPMMQLFCFFFLDPAVDTLDPFLVLVPDLDLNNAFTTLASF